MQYIGDYNPLYNLLLTSGDIQVADSCADTKPQKPQNIGSLGENQYHLTKQMEGENSRKQRSLICFSQPPTTLPRA